MYLYIQLNGFQTKYRAIWLFSVQHLCYVRSSLPGKESLKLVLKKEVKHGKSLLHSCVYDGLALHSHWLFYCYFSLLSFFLLFSTLFPDEYCYFLVSLREHAMLAKTAGVKHLVVLVNKMDDPTVEWDKGRSVPLISGML